MISRREFLTAGAAGAVLALTPDRLLAALEKRATPMPSLSTWPAVKAQFPLTKDLRHFSSFFIVSHPKPVSDAIDQFRRTLDASPFATVEHSLFSGGNDNLQLKTRADMAGYLGAKPDEIAIVPNTTTGLALVYHGLPLAAGDEVLTTTHDHFSHHESIRLAAERAGATVRKVSLFDRPEAATLAGITERLRAAIRPATRVVGLTWVHSSSGVRLPIPELAQVVRDANRQRTERHQILLVVDGVHGLGAIDAAAAELGADFFCAGTHKWMFAPRGTGIVWARAERWAMLRPTIPTFAAVEAFEAWMNDDATPRATTAFDMTPGGFHAYEHQWAMSAAFRFHEAIGRRRVAERIRQLNDRCKSGLASIRGVTLRTPMEPRLSAGLACFEVDRMTPEQVVARLLERRIVASASPYRIRYARLAPSLVNDEAEVDAALAAVREIARA